MRISPLSWLSLFLAHVHLALSKSLPEAPDSDILKDYTPLPASCLGLADADNVMLKLADDSPIVSARCSNEYAIINLKEDGDWEHYFASMRNYHYGVLGPDKDDHVNWQEWFNAGDQTNFIVSPDCQSCDASHELNHKYSTSSGYYMTPVTTGCTQLPIGRIGCDMDWNSYACRVCETAGTREPGYWMSYEVYNGLNDPETTLHFEDEVEAQSFAKYGLCGWTIRDAKAEHTAVTDTFEHCKSVTHEDVEGEMIMPRRKPSIGMDGRFCMCVQPTEQTYFAATEQELTAKKEKMIVRAENDLNDDASIMNGLIEPADQLTKLYQSDFTEGTYRITEPGKYIVMEDIVFDFKAPEGYKKGELDTYNDDNAWWPTEDQADDYPGAGDLKDSYFLGFWAGITIECADVILELNHHKLEMSEALYYQQSFFVLISLTSQIFLPGQGPGFFGAHPAAAQNVMIRNGELGLTSHHAIHGNFNKNVLVENVKIHDFKTHGIQFNGFDGVTIRNVDVGPNRKVDKLTAFYAHMKALLPTYKMMLDSEEVARETCLDFTGPRYEGKQCVTLSELVEDVQTALDMAFEYVVIGKDWDAIQIAVDSQSGAVDSELAHKLALWKENRDVLINNHHSTQTATLYGIFLNYIGSNVIGWYAGSETTKSHNVLMEHVNIHDLHHDTYENIAFSQGDATASQRILNCLNAPFNAYHIFGNDGEVDMISRCNNYADEVQGDDVELCDAWRDSHLSYVGNTIVDIQILSFELINRHGLSWNYCAAGAADMASLADFAFRGTPFIDGTPLLVGSHDPMIHPGKGVMGLRLNGVDYVDLKDVKIENIHSSTGLGTMLGGSYEQVVSQQAPYMNGFSMNMVNGLSATFTTNVVISNVDISHIISNTGLAYGVSVWYETHMRVVGKKGLSISHVHAGAELAPSKAFRRDSYPNLKPEGCAFRVYDDVIYKAVIDYNDNSGQEENLEISCVTGHTGCHQAPGLLTNIGEVSKCADPELADTAKYQAERKEEIMEDAQKENLHVRGESRSLGTNGQEKIWRDARDARDAKKEGNEMFVVSEGEKVVSGVVKKEVGVFGDRIVMAGGVLVLSVAVAMYFCLMSKMRAVEELSPLMSTKGTAHSRSEVIARYS